MIAIMYVIATGKPVAIVKYVENWNGQNYWIDISSRKWLECELTIRN